MFTFPQNAYGCYGCYVHGRWSLVLYGSVCCLDIGMVVYLCIHMIRNTNTEEPMFSPPSSLLPTSLSSHYRGGRLRCDDDRSAWVIRSFYCHGGGNDDVLVAPLCIARNVTHSVAHGLDRIGIVRDVDRPRPSHYVRLVRGMLAKGAQLRSLEPLEEGGGYD